DRVFHAVQRQVEVRVKRFQTGQAAGGDAGAVIAAMAGNDFLFLRAAQDVVVVPDDLDLGFIGVGAGQAVIDLFHAGGRPVDDAARQLGDGVGRVSDIGVVVGQPFGLFIDGFGHLGAAVADIDAIQ